MGNEAKEQHKKIHAHVFFLGARRLSRSDWDPPRATSWQHCGVPDQTSPGPGWDQSGPQVPKAPQVQLYGTEGSLRAPPEGEVPKTL